MSLRLLAGGADVEIATERSLHRVPSEKVHGDYMSAQEFRKAVGVLDGIVDSGYQYVFNQKLPLSQVEVLPGSIEDVR
jgi:hypothetical protein